MAPPALSVVALIALAAVAACGGGRNPLRGWAPKKSPHEAYAASLRDAALDKTALGSAWLAKADAALAAPSAVTLPFTQSGYFDPARPDAVAFRFDARRGRALAVDITFESAEPGRLFVDLFGIRETQIDRVGGIEDGALQLRHVVRWDGVYVLRLQPELLRGGRYTISQRSDASLRFPVDRAGDKDVQSVFGDARDGGRRDHHGVDIFAPRGTPVVAAADGVVSRINTTTLGGKVIWLSDLENGQSLYYAHLDSWASAEGQSVKAGDVIGYVGNTGNARSTPPHLHFGIYRSGPVDPLPFIRSGDRPAARPAAPATLLGEWTRVVAPASLRRTSASDGPADVVLPKGTVARVMAAVRDVVRVDLPDGRSGYLETAKIAPATRPVSTSLARSADVHAQPSLRGIVITRLGPGSRVPVLGEFQGFLFIELPGGGRGWLPRQATS